MPGVREIASATVTGGAAGSMKGRLRFPCSHGRYERHATYVATDGTEKFIPWHVAAETSHDNASECPGGEFLTEDAEQVNWCIIHKSEASLGTRRCSLAVSLVALGDSPIATCRMVEAWIILDTRAVREDAE